MRRSLLGGRRTAVSRRLRVAPHRGFPGPGSCRARRGLPGLAGPVCRQLSTALARDRRWMDAHCQLSTALAQERPRDIAWRTAGRCAQSFYLRLRHGVFLTTRNSRLRQGQSRRKLAAEELAGPSAGPKRSKVGGKRAPSSSSRQSPHRLTRRPDASARRGFRGRCSRHAARL